MKDNSLIARLYNEYYNKLYIHAFNVLSDQEAAKDIVNDVFCQILEKELEADKESDILPLLYIMVRNKSIDYIRHLNSESKTNYNYVEELFGNWNTKDYIEYEKKIELIQKKIDAMAPQMRTVMEEYFLNDKKCSEISEELNISYNTVRTHINRALKILRKDLDKLILFFM